MEQLSFEDAFRAELGDQARPEPIAGARLKFFQVMPRQCAHDECPSLIRFFVAQSEAEMPKFCPDHGGPKEPLH